MSKPVSTEPTVARTKNNIASLGMAIRFGEESDFGLVYDSMTNSLHTGNPIYKCTRMNLFKRWLKGEIRSRLKPQCLNVVCDLENPSIVYGWILHDFNGKVIYLYVTQLWRSKGIGTALLNSVPALNAYAFWTFAFKDWARKHNLELHPVEFDK